jgi:SAM-dependent methyltransferase
MSNGKLFFDTYVAPLGDVTVIDLGSQDVNGSLRQVCPANARYIGVDFAPATNVDVILTDPYALPFATGSVDAVVTSSCFEHSEMFWLVFNEVLRVLKPGGLFYLNVPSNGAFHRYPVDCWRFYPDSGKALVSWARRSGLDAELLESFTCRQDQDIWNDFIAVFVRDAAFAARHPERMLTRHRAYENGIVLGNGAILNPQPYPEDFHRLVMLSNAYTALQAKAADLEARLRAVETNRFSALIATA